MRIGQVALARVTVATIDEAAARVVLRCEVHVDGELVMDGVVVGEEQILPNVAGL